MRRLHPSRLSGPVLLAGLATLTMAALSGAALASQESAAPDVSVSVQVEREVSRVDDSGQTVTFREPVETAHPGDVLVYTLRARNEGGAPAFRARVQDPIPQGTVLIPDSVSLQPDEVEASLDGGSTWHGFPVLVGRTLEDGRVEQVPAAAEAYTNLRWVLNGELEPGDQREVSFKVRIR